MYPCYFSERSDEKAMETSAKFLEIPSLSEEYFEQVGRFALSRRGGSQIFPAPTAT